MNEPSKKDNVVIEFDSYIGFFPTFITKKEISIKQLKELTPINIFYKPISKIFNR